MGITHDGWSGALMMGISSALSFSLVCTGISSGATVLTSKQNRRHDCVRKTDDLYSCT